MHARALTLCGTVAFCADDAIGAFTVSTDGARHLLRRGLRRTFGAVPSVLGRSAQVVFPWHILEHATYP
jgi:hypothetical protein